MASTTGSQIIEQWPYESREAAGIVIDTYGEPQEATDSVVIWHGAGPWKRIEATRAFYTHDFPAPHHDSVESFIDYRVPPEMASALVQFDGSVVIDRTVGELSARCHDEQANLLALNLAHDIVTGARTVDEAREYYATEFLNARRNQPTPYMERLHFNPGSDTADPDERVLSEEQIEAAQQAGNL